MATKIHNSKDGFPSFYKKDVSNKTRKRNQNKLTDSQKLRTHRTFALPLMYLFFSYRVSIGCDTLPVINKINEQLQNTRRQTIAA
jgi:hypothetical protein